MRLSNKSTFSLACLIILLAFVAVPVMAHQPPTGQTFAESHDGVQNSATQDAAELAAETGHSHLDQPGAPSVTLVDLMIGEASTVVDTSVQLISDLTADPFVLTDLTGQNEGSFQVKITFIDPVYSSVTATSADAADLTVADLTVTAAKRSAPSANIFTTGNVSISSVTRMDDDAETTDVDESLNNFIVTFAVAGAVYHDGTAPIANSFPIDIWLTVNADVLFNLDGTLVNGVAHSGRGNMASSMMMFSVVDMLPAAPAAAPTTLAATTGTGQGEVGLTWSVVTGATSYEYSSDGGTTWMDVPGSTGATTTYTVTGLTAGTSFDFQVRGKNAQGSGPATTSESASTIAGPDTTAPSFTVATTPAEGAALTAGATVQFTLTATEALGTGNNELLEADVQGTTNVASKAFVKVSNMVYVVIVTPTDITQPIVLTIPADAVMDAAATLMVMPSRQLRLHPQIRHLLQWESVLFREQAMMQIRLFSHLILVNRLQALMRTTLQEVLVLHWQEILRWMQTIIRYIRYSSFHPR